MQITKTHLSFLEEAKQAFEREPHFLTYRNTEDSMIALRTGMDNDCIQIYELGPEIALFAQCLERRDDHIVPTEMKKFEIQRLFVNPDSEMMDLRFTNQYQYYEQGIRDTLSALDVKISGVNAP